MELSKKEIKIITCAWKSINFNYKKWSNILILIGILGSGLLILSGTIEYFSKINDNNVGMFNSGVFRVLYGTIFLLLVLFFGVYLKNIGVTNSLVRKLTSQNPETEIYIHPPQSE